MWTFIIGLLGPGRAIVLGLTAASFVFGVSGAYVKGRMDCAANYEVASLRAQLAQQTKEIEQLQEAMSLGEELSKVFTELENKNDELEKGQPSVGAGDSCADPGFLRWLDTLR